MKKPDQLPAWQSLLDYHHYFHKSHMRDLFTADHQRFDRYSLEAAGLFLDYSKNRIDDEALRRLIRLAEESELDVVRQAMYSGEKINFTERRAVLHCALRNQSDQPVLVDGKNVMPLVRKVFKRLRNFSEDLRNEKIRGYTGKPISHIVNIGIGGSHLGPMLVNEALNNYRKSGLHVSFVSGTDISQTLDELNPETTLFIIVSKTFTTLETMWNSRLAKEWLLDAFNHTAAVAHHFVAVSTNVDAATQFGIKNENIFEFWDWVGGRYSLWSAVGLSVILTIGMNNFESLLKGAYLMDEHFRNAPLDHNMPVIMALMGIWYGNFYGAQSQCVIPYDERLRYLPFHLQQLDMESNGKSINTTGSAVGYATGPIIFGSTGPDCQHAYFQSLHQGSHLIPVDFIAVLNDQAVSADYHETLISNCFAQSEALMRGKTEQEVRAELTASGHNRGEIELLTPHRSFPGNKPSNTLLIRDIDPESLGALIALYEHKVFVQGVIWKINSFDQWGVELGKQLAQQIKLDLHRTHPGHHDSSTEGLMQRFRSSR